MSTILGALDSRAIISETQIHGLESERKALEFFARAELSDSLQSIWGYIKTLPINSFLKLIKAVALLAAAVLFAQSLSLTGLLALAGSIAGLLWAAIGNVLVWLIYIPLGVVRQSDLAVSLLFATGMAWFAGVSPLLALVVSPVILFGFRRLERSDWAQQSVSTVAQSFGGIMARLDLGTSIRKATNDITGFIGYFVP